MIVLLTGLPGTGKSYLGRALAAALDADILDRDRVRDSIFPARDLDYTPEQNELASQVTYRVAEYILQRDPNRLLILDGRPFSRKDQVDEVVRLAGAVHHRLRVVYCTAPDQVVRERLAADQSKVEHSSSGRTIEKYYQIRQSFEPLSVSHVVVDTTAPLQECIDTIVHYLNMPDSETPD